MLPSISVSVERIEYLPFINFVIIIVLLSLLLLLLLYRPDLILVITTGVGVIPLC